eukprot:Em0001g831a
MSLQWNAPLQPDYVITAYTLHHRVPSLKSQAEMWAPPSTATVQFHTYNPSSILFYQINSVVTDFLIAADPENKKASVRDSYKADPEKKKASVRDSYKADPEKKKASVRDSYNADIESKQSTKRQRYQEDLEENRAAKRQRYQEDVEENRAAKRQKYEDNSAAIKASERNRYWNDPAVRLAKRAAERKRYRRGHRTTPLPPKGMDDDYRGIPHYGSPIVTGGRQLYKGGGVPIPYSGLWLDVDDDGPLHHIGEGEEVEVRVGLYVVFTACLLPLGECLHGGKHQGNGSMEGGTRGMAA